MPSNVISGAFKSLLACAACTTALATPALPAPDLAEKAVEYATAEPKAPVATTTPKTDKAAAQRQKGVQQATQTTRKRAPRTAVVRSTAYNSVPGQTDSTPFITATGTRTRFGVVALSRDLLQRFPYGTRLRIEDLSGKYNNLLAGKVFVVEDTMHPRKRNTVDVWMSSYGEAMRWGVRNIRITVVE